MADLDITLTRPADMLMVDFAGHVLESGQPDESIVVVIAVIEHGGQITTREFARHLLGTDATHLARRILETALHRDLVEQRLPDSWTATDAGIQAVERNAVVKRTFGLWRATFIEDSLIGTLPYSLEALRAPPLWEEINRKNNAGPEEFVPQVLRDVAGEEFKLPGVPGNAPVIESVDSEHCLMTRKPGGAVLEWVPNADQAHIISGEVRNSVAVRSLSQGQLGTALAYSLEARWDPQQAHLRWPESLATDRDVMTQRLDLAGVPIDIDEFGSFTCVTGQVPIVPEDASDAVRWLIRRCHIATDNFIASDCWPAHRRRLVQGLGGGEVDQTTQQVAAAEIRSLGVSDLRGRTFWYLQAPLDWGL